MRCECTSALRLFVSHALNFSLLYQSTGIAPTQTPQPEKTRLAHTELIEAGSAEIDFEPLSGDRWDLVPSPLEDASSAVSGGVGSSGSWKRSSLLPRPTREQLLQVAQLGGAIPLPQWLMSWMVSGPSAAQVGPPTPRRPKSDSRREPVPASQMAALQEKAAAEQIPLIPGFNLISLPEEPTDTTPAAILNAVGGQFRRIEAYDACHPSDPWKIYDPVDPAGSTLTAIDHRIGWWIDANVPTALPSDGVLPAATTMQLCLGWNLIGFPAGEPRHPLAALSSIAGRYERIFAYDAFDPEDPWEIFDPAVPTWANDLELMHPGRGYWVLVTEPTTLEIRNTGPAPAVAIGSPADLDVVTQPIEVVATVASDRLSHWTLGYRAIGDGEPIVLAAGNAPVTASALATFDPTLLINGLYELEITATDVQGQQVTESIAVAVEGQMKIGHFTLSFVDLAIPVSGLDVEVIRTYDSRDKRQGDFGVGWTLEVRQGGFRHNRVPGEGWQIFEDFLPCETAMETASHVTVVTLSDLEVYRFTLELESLAPTTGGCVAEARYKLFDGPVAGATLEILSNAEVFFANGSDALVDVDTLELFNPDRVRLSTRDGRSFELSLARGVERVEDQNGNSVVFRDAAIIHSSGKTLTLERDVVGRITQITDPRGHQIAYDYNQAGDLVSVTDQVGKITRFTYDDAHRVLEIKDPLGHRAVRNDYDASGRLVRTTDALGKAIEFTHDLDNRRQIIRDRLGDVRILEYDARGNIVREVDERGGETRRVFDDRDNLIREIDPLERLVTFAYDAADNITEVTDPLGHKTLYTYNSRGQVLTRRDPNGGVQTNVFDEAGRLLQTEDPLGNRFDFAFDGFGDLTQVTDGRGCVFDLVNNADGLVSSIRTAAGTSATYTYDANGNRTSETIGRTLPGGETENLTTTFAYDSLNRPVTTTYSDGSITEIRYNELGLESATVDELGRQTTFEYDALGRLIRTRYPDGSAEEAAYDASGRRISFLDRASRDTRFAYDSTGNSIETVFADGSRKVRGYDAAGRRVRETDERGGVWRFEYDAANNLTAHVDPLGNRSTFSYDGNGNQISMTDANGNTVEFEYDLLDRQRKILYADNTTDESIWDALGRLVARVDQNGHRTEFEYDCAGRLTQVKDALSQVTTYAYDEAGNQIAVTDAEGRTSRFTYDKRGRVVSHRLPLGQVKMLTYNAVGRPVSITDFDGYRTTFAYDAVDRLIHKSHVGADSVTTTFTVTGQRNSVTTSRGTWSFTYDDLDRLTSVAHPSGRSVSYTYDPAGNRTTITSSTGTTLYRFDAANRLIEVEHGDSIHRFAYDPNGNRTSIEYANGTSAVFLYDSLDRLTALTHRHADGSMLASYAYSLDPEGNRVAVTEASGRSVAYVYDEVYRLRGEAIKDPVRGNKTLAYTFDRVGNRITSTEDGVATQYTYDANDRLLTAGPVGFEYDANGNLIRRTRPAGIDTYEYDRENRLIRASVDGRVVDLDYDDDGLRIRRTVDSTETTEFLYDGNRPLPRVLAEFGAAGNPAAVYHHGREILSMVRGGDVHTFHLDAQGTTRQLTDGGGAAAAEYGFDAFGVPIYESGNVTNDYRYIAEPIDPDLGLTYLRARHYAPEQGRFLATDPLQGDQREPLTQHDYLYAGADPVNRSDPTGLFLSLTEVNVTSAAQTSLRGRQGVRTIRFFRRGLTGKKWDAYVVGEPLSPAVLRLFRRLPLGERIRNHYFIYLNKRQNQRGVRFDVGASPPFPRVLSDVTQGSLTFLPGRFSSIRRGASKGPWRVGFFNRKQRGIWLMLAIPPGFSPSGVTEIVKYSLAFPPRLLGNPLKGEPWEKITINCYTWTAYAGGVAIFVSFLPIR